MSETPPWSSSLSPSLGPSLDQYQPSIPDPSFSPSPSPSPSPSADQYPPCLFDLEGYYYKEYAHNDTVSKIRAIWDNWEVRILILYILFFQLYLHVLGSLRHRKTNMKRIKVSVWPLYLLADLLATIALGKLSKLSETEKVNTLRVLWAPIILFYLGGPDIVTILSLEKTDVWLRHFIGLLVHGTRTSHIMFLAWTNYKLSWAALVMLFSGIIKYGERVWIIRSRAKGNPKAYVQFADADQQANRISNARPKAGLILRAYSYFQTLKPHVLNYVCTGDDLKVLVKDFSKRLDGELGAQNAFELIEIELEFMHDMIFSKIGTIFIAWGCTLRVISFSCLVVLFVLFYFELGITIGKYFDYSDHAISGILLIGAIFLDVAGVIVQLLSDWGVIWASKHQSKMMNPIFCLQEGLISKRKRWSRSWGQFDLVSLFCQNTSSKTKCCFTIINVPLCLKELIINQLYETSKDSHEIESPLALAMRKGEWMPLEYQKEFKWNMGLEFGSSIVIWHIATEVCYHLSETPKENATKEGIKALSHYRMHLLYTCPSLLICNASEPVQNGVSFIKNILEKRKSFSSNDEACKFILDEEHDPSNPTIDHAQKLAVELMGDENRWRTMSNVWVEMLCYAASNCPVKHHAEKLREGGKFLSHVWLLLLHFGVLKKPEIIETHKLIYGMKDEKLKDGMKDLLEATNTECECL